MNSPLAIGFIEGIMPRVFDRKHFLAMPILTDPRLEVIRQHAEDYRVNPRTVYRWLRDGVNLSDPAEVALHVASLKHPAPAAIDAAENLLKAELESLNS
jgi:hypothetical protein